MSVNHDVGACNGNGEAGAPVVWDPFKQYPGNANAGDSIRLEVCLTQDANASNGLLCNEFTKVSNDG